MIKMYVTPEMEIVETELACFLAASDPDPDWGGPTGHEEKPQAPGMVSFDDMDEDYMDEDNI